LSSIFIPFLSGVENVWFVLISNTGNGVVKILANQILRVIFTGQSDLDFVSYRITVFISEIRRAGFKMTIFIFVAKL